MRPAYWFVALIGIIIVSGTAWGVAQARRAACEPIPLFSQNMLPNADLKRTTASVGLPDGWHALAPGAELRGPAVDGEGFDTSGDGRALQLIGIANAIETPTITVLPNHTYCFAARALTDSPNGSTRLQLSFHWNSRPAYGRDVSRPYVADWQPIVQWTPTTRDWTRISAAFTAPADATTLVVRITPASDDRVYLDLPQLFEGGTALPVVQALPPPVIVVPWPNGARGALSFSFDWETAMGGLIHSRSVDDAYGDSDPVARALRMREGVTTTLKLFAPHNIRATYFANGYNFLLGNTEARTFLGDPIYIWARTDPPYNWRINMWTRVPWFAPDPHGTVASDPAWYFGDLVPGLLAAEQEIQSHTFSHLYAGFASPAELAADAAEWNRIAAEVQIPAAQALAFPWSGSAGMSDTAWQKVQEAGITVVTRTNRSQAQYQLVRAEDVACREIPAHPVILVCSDFYLTTRSAPQAIGLIDRAITQGGMIDLWAHTEEVVSNEQIAAWGQVVEYAATRQAAGELWIAPLREIADWQRARDQLRITQLSAVSDTTQRTIRIENPSTINLNGLVLETESGKRVTVDVAAGETIEVRVGRG